MKPTRSLILAVALFSLFPSFSFGQPVGDERGVQVLTRGPVHEAFAETVALDPEPTGVVRQPPPEAIEELPPDQRPDGENIAWIPGYWAWDDEQHDYLWVSGVWRAVPPGREWVPGYWSRAEDAYRWVPGYWADVRADEVTYLPEPPDSVDQGPNVAAPSDDYFWVPGSWVWHLGRYAWRPGYWVRGQRDWMWMPSHYVWTPRGYVYSDGYWDYCLERRGVLFAPVRFAPEVYRRRHFTYSPAIVIDLGVFTDHLFLRPRDCHYYFGDYYAATYRQEGFIPSYEVRSIHHAYDPVFTYERFVHRDDRDWDRRIAKDYEDRRDHPDRRPPRTFEAIRALNAGRASSPNHGTAIASALNQVTQRNNEPMRFRKVAENDRKVLVQKGQDVRKTLGERRQLESTPPVKAIVAAGQAQQPTPVKRSHSSIVWSQPQGKTNAPTPPAIQQPPQTDAKVQPQARKPRSALEEVRKGSGPHEPVKTQGLPQPIKPTPKAEPKQQPKPEPPRKEPNKPQDEKDPKKP